MKTLAVILMLVLSSNIAFAIEDTVKNRSNEVERYFAIMPPNEMLQDVAKQMAQNYPPEKRELIIKIFTQYFDVETFTKSIKDTMVKLFTADELAALANFYGSPVGISAMKKLGIYMSEMMPTIQAETAKAVAKANKHIKESEGKDKTEPAN